MAHRDSPVPTGLAKARHRRHALAAAETSLAQERYTDVITALSPVLARNQSDAEAVSLLNRTRDAMGNRAPPPPPPNVEPPPKVEPTSTIAQEPPWKEV